MTRSYLTGSKFNKVRSLIIAAAVMATATALPAQAALLWSWNYAGEQVAAAGTFVTNDTPDNDGFYQITGITGSRNGVEISSLQPKDTAIPGNNGFPVDNLVTAAGLLTKNGFGFEMADGTYSNPFFATFLDPQGFLEVFTQEPFDGYNERPITFSAAIAVPEPGTTALMLSALAGLAAMGRRRERSSGHAA